MANLSGVNLDPNVEESSGGFNLLPAGKYKAVIVGDVLRDNNKKNGKILELKVQVTEGPNAGDTLLDYINITNPSAQCQAIGQGTLKRICNLCKIAYPPSDTSGLYGKPMVIKISQETFSSNKSGETLTSNKIKSYNSANSETGPAPTEQFPPPNTNENGGW